MGRLTKRDKNGNAFYVEYAEHLGVHKLADYEDAEEQGRLIEFPVAIDDHVWCFPSETKHYRKMQVIGLSYELGAKYVEVRDMFTSEGAFINVEKLGRIMFLTEEEAKAKLAEMETQNGQADKI